jgi:hypothetical protein
MRMTSPADVCHQSTATTQSTANQLTVIKLFANAFQSVPSTTTLTPEQTKNSVLCDVILISTPTISLNTVLRNALKLTKLMAATLPTSAFRFVPLESMPKTSPECVSLPAGAIHLLITMSESVSSIALPLPTCMEIPSPKNVFKLVPKRLTFTVTILRESANPNVPFLSPHSPTDSPEDASAHVPFQTSLTPTTSPVDANLFAHTTVPTSHTPTTRH